MFKIPTLCVQYSTYTVSADMGYKCASYASKFDAKHIYINIYMFVHSEKIYTCTM
jgi:hypothetical protein